MKRQPQQISYFIQLCMIMNYEPSIILEIIPLEFW